MGSMVLSIVLFPHTHVKVEVRLGKGERMKGIVEEYEARSLLVGRLSRHLTAILAVEESRIRYESLIRSIERSGEIAKQI